MPPVTADPANHWRKCAGSASNDDVLVRPPLQVDAVEQHVVQPRHGPQNRLQEDLSEETAGLREG